MISQNHINKYIIPTIMTKNIIQKCDWLIRELFILRVKLLVLNKNIKIKCVLKYLNK